MTIMDKCYQCGSELAVIKDKPYKYDECGLNVILYGINQFVCKKCKEHSVSIPKIKELHRAIGRVVCSERKGLLTGEEIKFLRKDLQLKAKDFAKMLGVVPQTVSRWENNKGQIGEAEDRLLRSLYMLYVSEQADHVVCHGVVQMFSDLPVPRKKIKTPLPIKLNPPDWIGNIRDFCPA